MTSTYSPKLRLNLMGNGDQSGTWGSTTNINLGTLLEQSIAGAASVNIDGLTSYTLTAYNGVSDESRAAVILLSGTLSANCNVICPSGSNFSKVYYVYNGTTGGFSTVFKTASGSGVTIPAGGRALVLCDGTNVTDMSGGLSVTANTSTPAFRIAQSGSGYSLLVEDAASPDTTPFVVDASGNVGVGVVPTSKIDSMSSAAPNVVASRGDGQPATFSAFAYGTSVFPYVEFYRSRGNSAARTTVADADGLGVMQFYGFDGTNTVPAASIVAYVDGTPGTGDMPGRIVFSTTADGASTTTERLRIGSAGQLGIAGANYGTTGQVLTSAGNAAAPTWSSPTIVDGSVTTAKIADDAVTTDKIADSVTLTTPTLSDASFTNYTETTKVATGTSLTVSLADGTVQKITTTGNVTITLPSSVIGKSFVVMVTYGGTHSVTWAGGSSIKWNQGVAPTPTSTSGKTDIFSFFQDGTSTYGSIYGLGF